MKLNTIWKNWPVHNLIAHPLSEVVHWVTCPFFGSIISGWIHDVTIPENYKYGRG